MERPHSGLLLGSSLKRYALRIKLPWAHYHRPWLGVVSKRHRAGIAWKIIRKAAANVQFSAARGLIVFKVFAKLHLFSLWVLCP